MILQGDCLEIMRRMDENSIDAIVMDPPFVFAGGMSNGRSSEHSNQFFLYWWKDVCIELDRLIKPTGEGFMWCDWRSAPTLALGFEYKQRCGLRMPQMIYHYREMGGMGRPFRNSVDMIAYLRGAKAQSKRIPNTTHNWISKYWYYGKHEYHPAEKDVAIAQQLVKWCSDEGNTILDPFAGSGTTAIACLNTNRNYILIEKEKEYIDTINKRIAEHEQQLSIFE